MALLFPEQLCSFASNHASKQINVDGDSCSAQWHCLDGAPSCSHVHIEGNFKYVE